MKKLLNMLVITGLLFCMCSFGVLAEEDHPAQDISTLDRNDVTYQDTPSFLSSTTYIGNFEDCTNTLLKGWAWNSESPNSSIQVHIYITNIDTGESKGIAMFADQYRADLQAAGIGNGKHAFSYAIDWYNYVPGTYRVEAFAYNPNGGSPQLANSPKTFVVNPPTGHFEECSSSRLKGWAWKPQCPERTIQVHFELKNMTTGNTYWIPVFADQYRADLQAAGIGNGKHAFSVPIDWDDYPDGYYAVTAHAFVSNWDKNEVGTRTYANGYVPPSFMWPTTSKQITSYFGWRTLNGTQNYHRGIDIAPLSPGAHDSVFCFSDGVVVYKATDATVGYGNAWFVAHTNPRPATGSSHVQTLYGHLNAFAGSLSVGSSVSMGQTLGYMGNTGNSFGVHLHFGTYSAASLAAGRRPESAAFNPLGNYFTTSGGVMMASVQQTENENSTVFDEEGRLIVDYYYLPDEQAMGE